MRRQLLTKLNAAHVYIRRRPCLPAFAALPGAAHAFHRPFHPSTSTLQQVARDPIAELRRQEESEFYDEEEPEAEGKLGKLIRDSIRATGPIPVSRYMQFCLGHPIEGYYTRDRSSEAAAPSLNFDSTRPAPPATVSHRRQTDVFGRKGDFITSPEISQVFGELVAVWLVMQWMEQGSPKKVRLVELGPGRGTLMDDILRTLHALPTFPTSSIVDVHLIETSEPLRKQQEEKIGARIRTFGGHADSVGLKWSDRLEDVPQDPSIFNMVVAHEFFDALPINVFQKTENGFREVYVNLAGDVKGAEEDSSSFGLTLGLAREATTLSKILPATSPRYLGIPVGERIEISPESWQVMRSLGEVVSGGKDGQVRAGGAALVIDYGQDGASSNSFRAFRNHEIVHVFDDPGSADLTANVDFAYMKEALTGSATAHGPISQRDFLISLGLGPRLDKLLKAAKSLDRKQEIASAARRLVDSEGMGSEYKFLGVTPRASATEGGEKAAKEVYPFGGGETEKTA